MTTGKSSIFARFSTLTGSIIGFFLFAGIAGAIIAATAIPLVLVGHTGLAAAQNTLSNVPNDLGITPLSQKTTIYAKSKGKNVALASFYAQNRIVIKYDDLSKTMINATIAAEDIRYFQHGGVDPQSLGRAFLKQGNGGGGGSTIAMQYVKNVCIQKAELLSTQKAVMAAYNQCVDVSYARKLSDIRGAIALEKKYSKQDILLAYLNIVGFGGRVYGIEAAARYYYGVTTKELSPAQAASLIAIVNDPGSLRLDNPKNIKNNKIRRDYILKQEYTHKLLSKSDYEKAIKTEIKPKITPSATGCMTTGVAGFFCDYVVNELLTDPTFGATPEARYQNLQTAGWQVYTTLNLDLQKSAQKTMNTYVPKTLAAFKIGGAATSIEVGTGRILAMVQNKTYNNTASAKKSETSVNYNAGYNSTGFQPGSTYKVFTLLDWLKSGYSIYDTVNGNARPLAASNFTHCGTQYYGQTWTFGNDEPGEGGYMSVLRGTQGSVNGAFASMATQLDLCDIRAMAQSFGVESSDGSPLKDNPPSVIGGASSVPPMLMTAAYAGIANDGVYCKPIAIDKITTSTGKSVKVPAQSCSREVSKTVAKNARIALRAVFNGGTAGGDRTADGYDEFGKTGTTDSAVQTWLMGSTKKVTTGVWVGNVSGHTSLRQIYSTPYCGLKGSSQAAIERHCVWRGIQTAANKIYGD